MTVPIQVTARLGYRPEIDGLRAVAVIGVLINHLSRDIFPNGYLGVDIFFVISGYVITGSLSSHADAAFPDFLAGFFARRVRRIFPALFVCTLVSAVLICLVNPSPQMTLETGAAGLLGVSNIYLWIQSVNYFTPSVDLNIFTQTWSLGIEEQFYLLYPLLFWFSARAHTTSLLRKLFLLLLAVLAVASLILFVVFKQQSPAAAFFLLPSRFWELACGCLLFMGSPHASPILVPNARSWFVANFALVGLVMVLAIPSFMLLPSQLSTVLIVMFTGLLIASHCPLSTAYKLLRAPWLVAIGLASYSLYLWHWTVLSFSRWTIGLHWWSIPAQLGLIALLTWLSWRWVEQPFRRGSGAFPPRWILLSGLVVMSLGLGVITGLVRYWYPRLYLGRTSANSSIVFFPGARLLSPLPVPNCNLFEQPQKALRLDPSCGVPYDPSRPTLFVLGDSHGWQYLKSLKLYSQQRRINLINVWGNACPFPAAFARGKLPTSDLCYQRQYALQRQLLRRVRNGDIVFIANQLNAHFGGKWQMHWRRYSDDTNVYSVHNRALNLEQAAQAYKLRMSNLSSELNARGVSILFYLDAPQFPYFEGGETCSDQPFAPLRFRWECQTSKASQDRRLHHFFAWLENWRLQEPRRRFLFNASDYVTCPGGVCTAVHYVDSNHFKDYYADFVWNKFLLSPRGRGFDSSLDVIR